MMLPDDTKTENKNRTSSRCREWERERRNRFNNAINELGQLLRKAENNESTESSTLPKIDIIQKAIVFIKKFVLETSQLKSEVLAQQVKLQENKQNYKDASTQINKSVKTKLKGSKYNKQLIVKKCKHNALKEKSAMITVTGVKDAPKDDDEIAHRKNKSNNLISCHKLPKILPRAVISERSADNTIVVFPAGPYVIPQRPLLFPTAPPTFVLLDSMLQQTNRSSIPVVTRVGNESTKTTMVNILPITAFSHPLSVIKGRKTKVADKVLQKTKNTSISNKKTTSHVKKKLNTKKNQTQQKDIKVTEKDKLIQSDNNMTSSCSNTTSLCATTTPISVSANCGNANNTGIKIVDNDTIPTTDSYTKNPMSINEAKTSSNTIIEKVKSNNSSEALPKIDTNVNINVSSTSMKNINSESTESPSTKEPIGNMKDKNDKLPNILDTSLCENVVETGNTRLELAEELLAASPTAAFLMSFPLVSGNRAESPADETQNPVNPTTNKDSVQRRDTCDEATNSMAYVMKNNQGDLKHNKTLNKPLITSTQKENHSKNVEMSIITKRTESKNSVLANTTIENPFLNLPIPPMLTTSCSLADSVFTMDFDCNLNKSNISNQTSHSTNNNFLYKSDALTTAKNTIYSTSSISAGHDFNSLSSLYPCAMEKYTSKNKPDYTNVEDNIMKAHSSRLTYDIDLGWSHKSFDFVNCTTTSNTINKDNIFTTSTTTTPYTTSYNPFNPEFHVPLITNPNKKDVSKSTSYADTITNFYSQPSTLWPDEIPFYGSNNINPAKAFPNKQQCYQSTEHSHMLGNPKQNIKTFDSKPHRDQSNDNKNSNMGIVQQIPDKYSKKSPSKMHINWMTSETRSMQNNSCNMLSNSDIKGSSRNAYEPLGHQSFKKQDHSDANYFPIPIHNFSTPLPQEDFQVWPSARPLATAEISIDPPPINLPTLVGDLALGPHDKKRNIDANNRTLVPHGDTPNCNNFFSVTQLMNRSSETMASRYTNPNIDMAHKVNSKQSNNYPSDSNHKPAVSLLDTHFVQSGYALADSKVPTSFDAMSHYPNLKTKSTKSDKNSKTHKNNYSAEALLRGGTCSQRVSDNAMPSKFIMPQQKYHDFNSTQETPIAQVSHFPPILDYTDNGYGSQQISGTSLYSSTTNTISTSFYSNFIPGSSNLMSTNYSGTNFCGDFIDYNQSTECNYTPHKYEEFKPRNSTIASQEKVLPTNYKTSRRDTVTKHKLDCTKKDSNKKYQSKRPKLNHDTDDWTDGSNLFWQSRTHSKKHGGAGTDELAFPNYVGNQVPGQYQPEFFNTHLMSSNVQSVGSNMDRSVTSFPTTSRANFNLSTIFPEITMKVQ